MAKTPGRLSIVRAIINAILKQPETVDYPFGDLDIPEGFRGELVIDSDLCTGCGLCVRDCPAEALELMKESRQVFQLIHYPARCAYCGQCEDSCHRGAISHTNQIVCPRIDPSGWSVILHDKIE
jgi:formate hydrogenlyase subunit 6/NADH:ubiquinone oxidoreductase subunit I